MALVSNVKLAIEKGGEGERRKVAVHYTINFTKAEVLASTVYVEHVALFGADPGEDDHLVTLRKSAIRAQEEVTERKFMVSVSRDSLDEDGDTIILGSPIAADEDEIYARVVLTPFTPKGTSSTSNLVVGQFGAVGED